MFNICAAAAAMNEPRLLVNRGVCGFLVPTKFLSLIGVDCAAQPVPIVLSVADTKRANVARRVETVGR